MLYSTKQSTTGATMQLITSNYKNIPFIVPAVGFMWPQEINFPSCCGAGNGIQEKVIPDNFYGVNVSPACWVHDQMFALADPTWKDFYLANDTFIHNLKQIIEHESGNRVMKQLRIIRAYEYYAAVMLPGSIAFWSMKAKQGPEK